MLNSTISKFQYGRNIVTLETGTIARQSSSSIIASMDETTILISIVNKKNNKNEQNFFPLTVHYQERAYAAGRIPGSFFRREGRPSENEILTGRLIDRPIRPLFPNNYTDEIQIIATVISLNPQINPDIISIIGTSAALHLSNIPFNGPIGAARVGYINNQYILNPTYDEIKKSDLNLIISGTKDAVLMVESTSNLLNESKILDAIIFGHNEQKNVINQIKSLTKKYDNNNYIKPVINNNKDLYYQVKKNVKNKLKIAYNIIEKQIRLNKIDEIKNKIISKLNILNKKIKENDISNIFNKIEKKIVRKNIIKNKVRIDGREKDMIRALDIRTHILPRTHGSALFTRGETQALVTVTLGTTRDAQNVDELHGMHTDNILFHYNFLPYSVGEIGKIGIPKRREVGHGWLAKNSILAIMPKQKAFPYTIRIVSEITESNGSSSMASVCGASLALMDAGVPIKTAIAGIAMGLIKEKDKYVILSDILGDEDHLGDMDFKVAGSKNGITALQMDMKIKNITYEIIKIALNKAKHARIHIINVMNKAINKPKNNISIYAPRIYTMKIKPEKIKNIIGKGGSIIREITEKTGTSIEIKDNGTIKIAANNEKKTKKAIKRIKKLTQEIEVGNIYKGKITKIVDFGAFVKIGMGKEGLIHISQISEKRINKITDHLQIGQEVKVRVLEIDRHNRFRLSMK
ncbi:polyribonucleotide nucleotidyltransferase [Candidatus Purcelliella pentastirinorum]|uniref:Polyribonucleotide nucleotidyltransferase n=1 Tax=Candidatus Purcelliella pentastirinorum TaxID=472834 RepID=A0AAX3NA44_9ENTR|nr:polyribonucleotide nucleotidyltransferase [Candidatus Purcelliella pentastirinorum]WDI78350.1 polyribonucleotide nucleotidyltransferase [Candidatus Purcelliella pentastirinorum]WDR80622.1 polyribonucleotide nucleotidyltransferase [Candidatus Purcelliella pentastirinorum]